MVLNKLLKNAWEKKKRRVGKKTTSPGVTKEASKIVSVSKWAKLHSGRRAKS